MDIEYVKINKLNQSLLKKILISPHSFLKEKARYTEENEDNEIEKSHFVFGSMVDTLLLEPNTFENKYFVMQEINISDTIKQVIRFIYDSLNIIDSANTKLNLVEDGIILEAVNEVGYQTRWKDETRIKKIKEEGANYYNSLVLAKGKTIVSDIEKTQATFCVTSLKVDKYISQYLKSNNDKLQEIIFRKIVEFSYQEIEFKGELDEVYIDHQNLTIQPIDYKTTGNSVNMFKYDFWKFRYDFQAAVYMYGLKQDKDIQKLLKNGYRILPFKYIVVESKGINNPMSFIISDDIIKIGFSGGTLSNNKKLEGFTQAVARYKWHTEQDKWEYPMEYYLNNGYVEIEK